MTNKLREAEKRIEVLKINSDERINLAIDNKDKEIQMLGAQIERFKLEHEVEMNRLEQRVADLKSEGQTKDKNIESFKGQAQTQSALLSGHIDKLKDFLQQKTELCAQLDQTNRQMQEQVNEYKGQLSSLELKLSNEMQQHAFDRDQYHQERLEDQS